MTRETLSYEVGEVLELPRAARHGKAYQIVNVILASMRDALLRGEKIRIDGLGTFSIRTRKATRRGAYFYPYLKKKGLHTEVINLPPKKYIHFKPTKPLAKSLNDHARDANPITRG